MRKERSGKGLKVDDRGKGEEIEWDRGQKMEEEKGESKGTEEIRELKVEEGEKEEEMEWNRGRGDMEGNEKGRVIKRAEFTER